MGDFNVVKDHNEKKGGKCIDKQSVLDFNDCLDDIEVADLRYTGCQFTWTNKQMDGCRIFSKLDRAMVNDKWLSSFPNSEAFFDVPSVSDHSPAIVSIRPSIKMGRKPFKFFNFWTKHKEYKRTVEEAWSNPVFGSPMFKLHSKLKSLKIDLKAFNSNHYGSLSNKVIAAKEELNALQREIQHNPCPALLDKEIEALETYSQLALAEEAFYKQKARDNIIKKGDQNTSYFHRKANAHCSRNKILSVIDSDGARHDEYEEVKSIFVEHYKKLLGTPFNYPQRAFPYIQELMQVSLPPDILASLDEEVTDDEIKSTLFSLHDHKAPGPDGFTPHFFKDSWSIIGDDFLSAIRSFFRTCKLLPAVNSTIIALIPKVPNPSSVTDYRPISCCSTVYKCISKIITNRLKKVMPHIISPSQSAFVKGRSISDQILLMQELVRNYHRSKISPRSALKIDLMKAFDSVSWDLILDILQAIDLPLKIREWIKVCITSPHFSISMNGSLEGYFPGAKGLRQGDPLSPYLFLLAMEFFSRLFNKLAKEGDFDYHPKCIDPLITHVCFADDLFILCYPNEHTFQVIHKALMEFHKYSGLQPNGLKSKVYIAGIEEQEKHRLCSILGFQLGQLPVRYLGVPLISTKLRYDDCLELLDKMAKKVRSWASKFLSYAGRLVLVKSVLFSIQVYWSMHFILPKKVCNSLEQTLRRFLWTGAELKKGGCKVAWDEVCQPKKEGGLGLCKVHDWNKAAIMRHLWTICSRGPSLWVQWCYSHLLKKKCFWEAKVPADCSWTWRKLLQLREKAIHISKYKVGNGDSISLWFSNWHPKGPLIPKYSPRIAYDAGLPKDAKVSNIINGGQWNWPYPNTWELREVILEHPPEYSPQPLQQDQFIWLASKTGSYSASATWNAIRRRSQKVPWHTLLWFPYHIPRHCFTLWMAIRRKLNTKDKLAAWGLNVDSTCVLCGSGQENLDHLFFSCPFSTEVRHTILQMCSITKTPQTWQNEVEWAVGKFSGKSFNNLFCKIAWGALVYHLWQERNARIFKGLKSKPGDIINGIKHEVRLKASQIPVIKHTEANVRFCAHWGILL